MYEYLKEHNYISRNENKNPLRQQELSKERAEAIDCKCENIIKEEKQELIEYLHNKLGSLNSLEMFGNHSHNKEIAIVKEILNKIEKSDK